MIRHGTVMTVAFARTHPPLQLALALLLVLGSYAGAQYRRVWRPRRRGQPAARPADRIPDRPADVAAGGSLARALG